MLYVTLRSIVRLMKFPGDSLSSKQIHEKRWIIHALMSLGLVLVIMSVSAINVALPTLVRDLGATSTQLQWIVDSYALVFAGLLLFGGAVGDRFGRRGTFLAGLTVFGVSTILSAFATSPEQLIIYRAIAGAGAAFIMPATLSIIISVFKDSKERGKAIAMWAGFAGASGAIGPILSGLMLKYFWWGSIFLIPLPVIAIAMVGAYLIVPTSKDPSSEKLDIFGAVLSVAGLGALLYGVIEAPNYGWLSIETILGVSIGAALLIGFVFWEKHTKHPMLPMEFFKSRRFTTGSLTLLLTFFALFGMFFVLIQFFQFVLGDTALSAALRTLPMPVTLIIVSSQVTKIEERFGTRKVVASGLAIVAVGFLIFATLSPDSTYLPIVAGLVLLGAGMGLAMPPSTEAIVGAVPKRKAGVGSAVNDTTREMGGALGIAVLGSVLNSGYRSGVEDLASTLPEEAGGFVEKSIGGAQLVAAELGEAGEVIIDTANQAFTDGMVQAMYVGAGFLVVSSLIVLKFMLNKNQEEPVTEN